ncbi:MAG: sarcosine oxidase subunit gamma [Roseiarcus sp.]
MPRRGALDDRALPQGLTFGARAAPAAQRFLLRGEAPAARAIFPAFGAAPPARPLASAAIGQRAALWLGPDEWLLIAEVEAKDLAEQLERALSGVFHSLVDVSHRQTGILLIGPGAARALAFGVALDLDLTAFPVGMVARTLLVKAEITLWRRAPDRFRVEVARSFAPYVAAMLGEAAEGL